MTLPVVFRRRFQNDLGAGFDWYEEQRPGLGEEFLSAIQSALKNVELYPELFIAVHGDVRRAIVSRFPFAIFYLVEPRRVVVLRVLHTARDPKLWPRHKRKAP
jgi:plasmid stabilization system protein ParE